MLRKISNLRKITKSLIPFRERTKRGKSNHNRTQFRHLRMSDGKRARTTEDPERPMRETRPLQGRSAGGKLTSKRTYAARLRQLRARPPESSSSPRGSHGVESCIQRRRSPHLTVLSRLRPWKRLPWWEEPGALPVRAPGGVRSLR